MFNREKQEIKRVPMMPVRDMVIFPQQMTRLSSAAKPAAGTRRSAGGDKKISCPRSMMLRWTTRNRKRFTPSERSPKHRAERETP